MKPLMRYDPTNRKEYPYPSEAEQYRNWHGEVAWMFNPYSGVLRDARDIGSDVLGYLLEEHNK